MGEFVEEGYRHWEGRLSVTMRQSHAGGDKLFADYGRYVRLMRALCGVQLLILDLCAPRTYVELAAQELGSSAPDVTGRSWRGRSAPRAAPR